LVGNSASALLKRWARTRKEEAMKRAVIVVAGVLVVIACAMIATYRTNSGTDKREGYWTDPETGEQVKILASRPIHVIPTLTPDRFMLIARDERLSQRP
jgi:hypothetical protein